MNTAIIIINMARMRIQTPVWPQRAGWPRTGEGSSQTLLRGVTRLRNLSDGEGGNHCTGLDKFEAVKPLF